MKQINFLKIKCLIYKAIKRFPPQIEVKGNLFM